MSQIEAPKSYEEEEQADEIPRAKSKNCLILDVPPSCLEFSRLAHDVFVVGTYSLHRDEDTGEEDKSAAGGEEEKSSAAQSRSGSLIVYRLNLDYSLSLLQVLPTASAVLDLHFSLFEKDILAVATSTGALEFYRLITANRLRLEHIRTLQAFDPTILVLSLAWRPFPNSLCPMPKRPATLAMTLSDGSVCLLDYAENSPIPMKATSHSQEAWTTAWGCMAPPFDSCILYSGGDDSRLFTVVVDNTEFITSDTLVPEKDFNATNATKNGGSEDYDIQAGFITESERVDHRVTILSAERRIHGAGVTAILPLELSGSSIKEYVVTGSYDEYIRVLTRDSRYKWTLMAEKKLGGGVWRLKLLDTVQVFTEDKPGMRYRILVSCMHTGARVVEILKDSNAQWSITVVAKFQEHESMNYGSDATLLQGRSGPTTFASTSFYDRKICIWNSESSIAAESDIHIGPLGQS